MLPDGRSQELRAQIDDASNVVRLSCQQLIPENILLHEPVFKGQFSAPVFLEVSPSDACSHTCPWCFTHIDRAERAGSHVPYRIFRDCLEQFIVGGGKSVLFSGGGEPSMYAHGGLSLPDLVADCLDAQLHVGLISNGQFLAEFIDCIDLTKLAMIRVSVDAGDHHNYTVRHGSKALGMNKVEQVVSEVVRRRGDSVVPGIGISAVVDGINGIMCSNTELEGFARLATRTGVDFVQIKHVFTPHHQLARRALDQIYQMVPRQNWGESEVWLHRVEKAEASRTCMIAPWIRGLNADGQQYPCSYRQQSNDLNFNEVIDNCDNRQCRYNTVNSVLSTLGTSIGIQKSISTLIDNITLNGFHPYRYFPSAPKLYEFNIPESR